MNKVTVLGAVALIFTLQTMYSTASWKFWQKEETKEIKKDTVAVKQEKKAQNDVQAFIGQHEKVVVMFILSSCPYCIYLKPIFNNLQKEFSGSVHLKTVVVNGKKDYYKKAFNLRTFPTVIYYKNGVEKKRHGSDNKRMTLAKMRGYVKSSL